MNATGAKGGAYGFRVSSINRVSEARIIFKIFTHNVAFQLVDTKSLNNTTLLHFLEKTISANFPHMEQFLDELEKPAEAYRGTYPGSYLSTSMKLSLSL